MWVSRQQWDALERQCDEALGLADRLLKQWREAEDARHAAERDLRLLKARSVGICGDSMKDAFVSLEGTYGTLNCDLLAGHQGWHGCRLPGLSERTSWTHKPVVES